MQVSEDGTLFIACGNTMSVVREDSTQAVQCGEEQIQSKEEAPKEENKINAYKKGSNQRMINAINKKSVKEKSNKDKEAELFGVHIVALSVGSTKCVVVSSNKVVEVWDVLTLERLATTAAPKRPTAVQLTKDESQVVVSDKSGDVYLYNIDLMSRQYLLGHVSMVLDLALSPSNSYLATCDRDEKVRISNFPNCYNVHQYCLGHTEFVSKACFVSDSLLASISGDKTLRLWDTVSGECLQTLYNTEPFSDLQYNEEHLFTSHSIGEETIITTLKLSERKVEKVSEASFRMKVIAFSVNNSKCLLLTNEPKVITAFVKSGVVLVEGHAIIEGLELKGLVHDQVKVKKTVPVDERTNDYFDRKRRRIEEENNKAMAKTTEVFS